ncbi:hypothetical protein JCM3770_006488 [Rhodotorula araucariae]
MSTHSGSAARILRRLLRAAREPPPQRVGLSPQAVQDKNVVEAALAEMGREAGRANAAAEATTRPGMQPTGSTSPSTEAVPHYTTSHTAPLASEVPARAPIASFIPKDVVFRPSLSGSFGPREQRHLPFPRPPVLAKAPTGPSNGRASRSHLPRVNALERARTPVAAKPTSAVPLVEMGRNGWRFDREKGMSVESRKARKARVTAEERARKAQEARAAHAKEPVKPSSHTTATEPYQSQQAAATPRALPLFSEDLESTLFARTPSSVSSVRLSESLPRAHFAARFQAAREQALATQVLQAVPRGRASVDLGEAVRPLALLRRERLKNRPRGGIADVGLRLRIDSSRPLDRLKERVVVAAPPHGAPATSVVPGVEPADNNAINSIDMQEPTEDTAEVKMQSVGADLEDPTESKPVFTPTIVLSVATSASHPSPTSPVAALGQRPHFLSTLSRWALDPRESTYPRAVRDYIPRSPLERRLGLLAQRIWADLAGLDSTADALFSTRPAASAEEHAVRVAAARKVRARRALEDRCLEGELARAAEQRVGRRALALVRAAEALEPVVEAYRAYRTGGVPAPDTVAERSLLERARRAEAALRAALAPAWAAAEPGDEGKAVLWAGELHSFVEWDAYIAATATGRRAGRPSWTPSRPSAVMTEGKTADSLLSASLPPATLKQSAHALLMSAPTQDLMEAETGLKPTHVAMPANTAREGIDVTDSTAPARSATLAAKPFASDVPPAQATTTTIEQHTTTAYAQRETPSHTDDGVTNITTGLGGMLVTGPLAALEKVSPALAHGVGVVASSVADGFHSLTGTGPQYHSTSSIDAAGLPDADQVKSAAGTTAQVFNDTVKPALASTAQQVHEAVKPPLASTAQQVQHNVPQPLGGQAPPATQQFTQPITTTRETGSVSSIEPPGVRKQVHPVGAGGTTDVPHTATTTTAPLVTGADVHGYVDLVKEKVREAGEMLSHVLPGAEKQQQMTDTAAKGLEQVPDLASSAAHTTATGLNTAAQTTAAYAAPAANYTASAATSAAQTTAGYAASAAHTTADLAVSAAQTTAGLAASAAHTVVDAAQRAAAQAHLPGWNAPTSEGVHTGSTASTGHGSASPMGESKAPGAEAQVVKDFREKPTGHGAVEEHYTHETRDRALPALTQETDAFTRGKEEGKGIDLNRTHKEAALDQQVATHDPDASLSKKRDDPIVARQAATLSHRDLDVSEPSTPGTATILSHQTLGGSPSYSSSGATGASSFGHDDKTSGQHALGSANPYSQLVGQQPYHGEGAVESAGFKSFEPTSSQSAGGQDRHSAGQTSSFMPHSSGVGHSSTSHPRSPGREDTHTPSHVDTSHHDGAPCVSGAGSPHTYSSTHSGESATVGAGSLGAGSPHTYSSTQGSEFATRTAGTVGAGSLGAGSLGAGSPQTYSSTHSGESATVGAGSLGAGSPHTYSSTQGSEFATRTAGTVGAGSLGAGSLGAGSPQTYSSTHSGESATFGASSLSGTGASHTTSTRTGESRAFGASSGTEPHPPFTKDDSTTGSYGTSAVSSGAHHEQQGGAFTGFESGQPPATGASAYGGTAAGMQGASATSTRGDYSSSGASRDDYSSSKGQRDTYSSSSAGQRDTYSSSSAGQRDTYSSPLKRDDYSTWQRGDHSTTTGTGQHAFTTLDELNAKSGASQHHTSEPTSSHTSPSATSKVETAAAKLAPTSSSATSSTKPHDSTTSTDFGSSSTSHGLGSSTAPHDSTTRTGAGAGAADSALTGKAERAAHDATSSSSSHTGVSDSTSRPGAHDSSLTGKADRAAHDSTPSSTTSASTGSAHHGATESHKPTLKERIKETLHHVAH